MPVTKFEGKELYPRDRVPRIVAVPWREQTARRKPEAVGRDNFPVFKDDPFREIHLLLNKYMDEAGDIHFYKLNPASLKSGKELLRPDETWAARVVMAAAARMIWLWKGGGHWNEDLKLWVYKDTQHRELLTPLLAELLSRKPQLTDEDIFELIELQTGPMGGDIREHIPPLGVVMAFERCFAGRSVPEKQRRLPSKWLAKLMRHVPAKKAVNWTRRLAKKFPSSSAAVVELADPRAAFQRLAAMVVDENCLLGLVKALDRGEHYEFCSEGSLSGVLDLLEKNPVTPEMREALAPVRESLQAGRLDKGMQQEFGRLCALLGGARTEEIEPGEAWANAARDEIATLPSAKRSAWTALITHCVAAEPSKPTKKWQATAGELVKGVGLSEFKKAVTKWFPMVALPRPVHREARSSWQPDPDLLIADRNAVILKGLAWACAGMNDPAVSRALSELAEICFKKVRNLGPRCAKVGNACLHSLSITTTDAAASQLSRLDATVKQPTAKKRIGKSLVTAATLTGQTKEDLEEKAVPTSGLDNESRLKRKFGDCAVELHIANGNTIDVTWTKGGVAKKSVPAEVKEKHTAAFKEFQQLLKDIQKMLPAQRARMERLLMTEREWDLESWRQRYLNQALLAPMARRLIWQFRHGERTVLGAWLEDKLVDVQSRAIKWLAPDTRVQLWHPIGAPVETVAAWRRWFEEREIRQPFKQAHREVYILTDAERGTETYSNRFARHILQQHQFVALAKQRGWQYSFMGSFDFTSTPTLELPAWNLNAEFLVEPAGAAAATGVARYVATDQVRFLRPGADDDEEVEVPLSEVPPRVFTEVMRDVDLFVGVASIGNDPGWQDTRELADGGDYWRDYAFGDLSAPATTRRDVLERLLPKLKVADRCELRDRFLVVRGSLRTYKIHLGSANILMEPNDQYLCIVADYRGDVRDERNFFLPFEGDRTLSLILSKAFMLADDDKIKDQSIMRQIKQK